MSDSGFGHVPDDNQSTIDIDGAEVTVSTNYETGRIYIGVICPKEDEDKAKRIMNAMNTIMLQTEHITPSPVGVIDTDGTNIKITNIYPSDSISSQVLLTCGVSAVTKITGFSKEVKRIGFDNAQQALQGAVEAERAWQDRLSDGNDRGVKR